MQTQPGFITFSQHALQLENMKKWPMVQGNVPYLGDCIVIFIMLKVCLKITCL